MRRRRATPIQNREKRTAETRERMRRPVTKEAKRRMGVRERRNWIARKDYASLAEVLPEFWVCHLRRGGVEEDERRE
jgi:hypothetical protein